MAEATTIRPPRSDRSVGLGVLGARSFVATRAVLPAVDDTPGIDVVAAASLSGTVPAPWTDASVATYDDVIEHPAVDAVYLPLPNGMHEEWTCRAAAAGKHVLCEKPLATDGATARRMFEVCNNAEVLLAEAWMTPFGTRWADGIGRAAAGVVGTIRSVDTRFTFTIGPEAADNYRWDPQQGGGALADVGIYCLGPIVDLFDAEPTEVDAIATMAPAGVDASIETTLRWSDGRVATAICSFVDDEQQSLTITGDDGVIELTDEPHTGGDPYRPMIAAFLDALQGREPWPRPRQPTLELIELIDRIRASSTAAPAH
ncbi:MAG: Gfo/Idh/MocA family oxidoreductase [Actinomycetota bacterium]